MYWTLELASKLEDAPWPATKDELIDYAVRSNVLTSDFYGCVRRIGLCGIPGRRTENRNENSDPRKGS